MNRTALALLLCLAGATPALAQTGRPDPGFSRRDGLSGTPNTGNHPQSEWQILQQLLAEPAEALEQRYGAGFPSREAFVLAVQDLRRLNTLRQTSSREGPDAARITGFYDLIQYEAGSGNPQAQSSLQLSMGSRRNELRVIQQVRFSHGAYAGTFMLEGTGTWDGRRKRLEVRFNTSLGEARDQARGRLPVPTVGASGRLEGRRVPRSTSSTYRKKFRARYTINNGALQGKIWPKLEDTFFGNEIKLTGRQRNALDDASLAATPPGYYRLRDRHGKLVQLVVLGQNGTVVGQHPVVIYEGDVRREGTATIGEHPAGFRMRIQARGRPPASYTINRLSGAISASNGERGHRNGAALSRGQDPFQKTWVALRPLFLAPASARRWTRQAEEQAPAQPGPAPSRTTDPEQPLAGGTSLEPEPLPVRDHLGRRRDVPPPAGSTGRPHLILPPTASGNRGIYELPLDDQEGLVTPGRQPGTRDDLPPGLARLLETQGRAQLLRTSDQTALHSLLRRHAYSFSPALANHVFRLIRERYAAHRRAQHQVLAGEFEHQRSLVRVGLGRYGRTALLYAQHRVGMRDAQAQQVAQQLGPQLARHAEQYVQRYQLEHLAAVERMFVGSNTSGALGRTASFEGESTSLRLLSQSVREPYLSSQLNQLANLALERAHEERRVSHSVLRSSHGLSDRWRRLASLIQLSRRDEAAFAEQRAYARYGGYR